MKYARIGIVVEESRAELACGLLGLEGFALEVIDQTTIERAPPGRVGYVVYCAEAERDATRGRIGALLEAAGVESEIAVGVSDEEEWRDRWKAYFKPRPVGPFVIVPSWESYAPAPSEIVLSLDPGRAFGTGGHASTRLCLRAIGALARCERFLDVGCGSGVLSIACALRWPTAHGVAIDIDAESAASTRENAEKNGVASRIDGSTTPIENLVEKFDVVLANIMAETLIALAAPLAARVAVRGRLIVSGILVEQAPEVVRAYEARGLVAVASLDEEGWCAVTLERR